jgi:molecular chaperone GrpE
VDTVDLATLVGQFTALRHEVNLQTRAVRAQQEQNAETLRQLTRSVDALTAPPASPTQPAEDELRPLLQTLVETHDALARAADELRRVASASGQPEGRMSWWTMLLGRRTSPHPDTAAVLTATVTGLAMSVQRVERALAKHDLRPTPATGEPFDPECMEVVEAVAGTGRPSGEVIEEVRRGYTWRGRAFRYAQVRVAK